jgi:hypothetical protein
MNRVGRSKSQVAGAATRVVWFEGAFRVECTGRGPTLELAVYYGRYLMSQEAIGSIQEAWGRAGEICRVLADGDAELGAPAAGRRA